MQEWLKVKFCTSNEFLQIEYNQTEGKKEKKINKFS